MPQPACVALACAVLAAVVPAPTVHAQQSPVPTGAAAVDEKAFKADAPGFYANADLSYVLTSGNSSSSSLGFKGDITRRFTKHSIGFAAGGIRASSAPEGAAYAVGTLADYEVVTAEKSPTTEAYYARGRYDFKLSDRLFYTLGAGWERNRFSGIENRWVADTGVGYIFLSSDRVGLRGATGVTYTSEEFTVDDGQDDSFLGLRAGWDFRYQLLETTSFTHGLIFDQSLENGGDQRFDAQVGLRVAMTARLGLKVNWRILYDNQPASRELTLFPYTVGATPPPTVLAPYKKTDQGLSVSLVFSVAPPKKS